MSIIQNPAVMLPPGYQNTNALNPNSFLGGHFIPENKHWHYVHDLRDQINFTQFVQPTFSRHPEITRSLAGIRAVSYQGANFTTPGVLATVLNPRGKGGR